MLKIDTEIIDAFEYVGLNLVSEDIFEVESDDEEAYNTNTNGFIEWLVDIGKLNRGDIAIEVFKGRNHFCLISVSDTVAVDRLNALKLEIDCCLNGSIGRNAIKSMECVIVAKEGLYGEEDKEVIRSDVYNFKADILEYKDKDSFIANLKEVYDSLNNYNYSKDLPYNYGVIIPMILKYEYSNIECVKKNILIEDVPYKLLKSKVLHHKEFLKCIYKTLGFVVSDECFGNMVVDNENTFIKGDGLSNYVGRYLYDLTVFALSIIDGGKVYLVESLFDNETYSINMAKLLKMVYKDVEYFGMSKSTDTSSFVRYNFRKMGVLEWVN